MIACNITRDEWCQWRSDGASRKRQRQSKANEQATIHRQAQARDELGGCKERALVPERGAGGFVRRRLMICRTVATRSARSAHDAAAGARATHDDPYLMKLHRRSSAGVCVSRSVASAGDEVRTMRAGGAQVVSCEEGGGHCRVWRRRR